MNPRQRRGVLLVGLAAVGAVAVFLAVSNYVAEVRTQVGPLVETYVLAEDLAPYQELTPDMIRSVEMPQRWVPPRAIQSTAEVASLVSPAPLPQDTMLQQGMFLPPPEIEEGQRELAILVDAETGVGGKVAPGSVVDIFATFGGVSASTGIEAIAPEATIVIEEATIVDVGLPTTAEQEDPATGGFGEAEVVPVTFALSVDESLRLAYIESFAVNVRLALRDPLDEEQVPPDQRTYAPERGGGDDDGDDDGDDGGAS